MVDETGLDKPKVHKMAIDEIAVDKPGPHPTYHKERCPRCKNDSAFLQADLLVRRTTKHSTPSNRPGMHVWQATFNVVCMQVLGD